MKIISGIMLLLLAVAMLYLQAYLDSLYPWSPWSFSRPWWKSPTEALMVVTMAMSFACGVFVLFVGIVHRREKK